MEINFKTSPQLTGILILWVLILLVVYALNAPYNTSYNTNLKNVHRFCCSVELKYTPGNLNKIER